MGEWSLGDGDMTSWPGSVSPPSFSETSVGSRSSVLASSGEFEEDVCNEDGCSHCNGGSCSKPDAAPCGWS